MRELTDGEREACRNRAIHKVEERDHKTTKSMSESDNWKSWREYFNQQAQCMERPAENFDRDKYFVRGHDVLTDGQELRCMLKGNLTGLETLKATLAKMEKNRLSGFNGTSVEFQECAAFIKQQEIRFEENVKMFETNGEAYKPVQKPSSAVIKARIYEIIAGLLFVPDLLSV